MFSDLFRMLDQEALVTRSCIGTGLTEMRNANLNDKGRFYSAFFQLSTGIERLAKLALILDHLAQNNLASPGKQAVKSFGHDLRTLAATVERVATDRGYATATPFAQAPIADALLGFLSEFATGMRYANLDGLSTGVRLRNPLGEWSLIVRAAITQLPASTARRIQMRSAAMAAALSDSTMVLASDLDESALTLETALSQPSLVDESAKYILWELVSLISPIRDVVVEAAYAADRTQAAHDRGLAHIPAMSEYFSFLWLDRPYVMRKRRWP